MLPYGGHDGCVMAMAAWHLKPRRELVALRYNPIYP